MFTPQVYKLLNFTDDQTCQTSANIYFANIGVLRMIKHFFGIKQKNYKSILAIKQLPSNPTSNSEEIDDFKENFGLNQQ